MPFRSQEVLGEWLQSFRALGHDVGSVRVIEQDGTTGDNTGLIALSLENAGTVVSIEPRAQHDAEWVVTFEAREQSASLSAADVAKLSDDLAVLAALCTFLQLKSQAVIDSLEI